MRLALHWLSAVECVKDVLRPKVGVGKIGDLNLYDSDLW